ncbi:hypothetical protein RhiJN_21073 [Ceratobasidium sp. AG-Ba]|nr:hypothetical protein RhiJN_18612 [Ceratobasidium sp. AG-Ba]QRV93055.1 hypothetical protein RhiJN_21073 [Ceratobasidium sp. AG-Ba]
MSLSRSINHSSDVESALMISTNDSDYDTDSTSYSDSTGSSDDTGFSDATSDSRERNDIPAREDVLSVLHARLRAQRLTWLLGQWASGQASLAMREIRTRFPEDRTAHSIERHALRRFPSLTEGMQAKLRLRLAYEFGRIKRIPPSFLDFFRIMAQDMNESDQQDFRERFVLPAARIAYRLPSYLENYLEPWMPSLHARTSIVPAPPRPYVG